MLRFLHCVCDSYNRIHVLIKDIHKATSSCQSPRQNLLPIASSKTKEGCNAKNLPVFGPCETHFLFQICSKPNGSYFRAIIWNDAPVKRCHKNCCKIEFCIGCNQGFCLSCKWQIRDNRHASAASATANRILRADGWHTHDSCTCNWWTYKKLTYLTCVWSC